MTGLAGRVYRDPSNKASPKERLLTESIDQTEQNIRSYELSLSVTGDNAGERRLLRDHLHIFAERISSRRAFIYTYVLKRYYELKYSGIGYDIFSRNRQQVDRRIGQLLPNTVGKFTAVYENLDLENPEDWSNAVHSCRRILQDLADVLFPPVEDGVKEIDGKTKTLGQGNYINRIMAYVED